MTDSKPPIVLYHAHCSDGFGAALAAWTYLSDNAEYVPVSYGNPPPDCAGRDVYIVDFSYDKSTMEALQAASTKFVVLDHHKTAMAALAGLQVREGIDWIEFDMTRSGAMMTWDYFHPKVQAPTLIAHIQDNDLWKFQSPNTKAFIRNLRSLPMTFDAWAPLMTMEDPAYEEFVRGGMAIERWFTKQTNDAIGATKREVTIAGTKGLAANVNHMFASEAGNLLANESGTFGLTWYVDGTDTVRCSLRSNGFDVGAMALPFGGGGHTRASGFRRTTQEFQELLGAA